MDGMTQTEDELMHGRWINRLSPRSSESAPSRRAAEARASSQAVAQEPSRAHRNVTSVSS